MYPPILTPVSCIQKISGFKYNLTKSPTSFFPTILSAVHFFTYKPHPQAGHSDGTKIAAIVLDLTSLAIRVSTGKII